MAHPGIHFQLFHQERLLHEFPTAKAPAERAAQILGKDLAGRLRPFASESPSLRLHGLAGPPDIQRANSQSVFLYVNGRPVADRLAGRAVAAAYDSAVPRGRFPVVVLFLDIPPDLVDVNVHPTKREVRFRSPGEVLSAVSETIRKAVENPIARRAPDPAVPPGPFREPAAETVSFREPQLPWPDSGGGFPSGRVPPPPVQASFFPPPAGASTRLEGPDDRSPASAPSSEPSFSALAVLGQAANTYILLEAPDGIVFLDQHAAHERILFDALSSASRTEPAQRLLRAAVVDLLPKEAARLRRLLDELAGLGFDVEPFGGDSFVIHAVPAALAAIPPDSLLREVLESVPEASRPHGIELLAALARTAACHQAVRAGQRLKTEEIRRLLESLDRTRISATCPHGRPLWFKLTFAEIARLFHRT